jgi:hypothetical protein
MIETDLVKLILVSLYQKFPNSLWYRRNVGAFKNKDRFVRFGLPGMADIGGIHIGKAIEIEVKTFKGKQSEEQKNWQKAVENAGGIYILSYDEETAIEIIKNLSC